MFGEYLHHRHYGGDQHFLNVPSSLRRPVSSQVSSKYILNVTYLLIFGCGIIAAGFRTLLLYEIVRSNVIVSIYAD